jgi:ribosomal protein S7
MVEKRLNKNFKKLRFNKKIFFHFQSFFFFKSVLLQKFTNIFIRCGKKNKAEILILNYLKFIKNTQVGFVNPVLSFFYVLETVKSNIDFVSKRVGKKVHFVPVPVRFRKQYIKSLRLFKSSFALNKYSKNFLWYLTEEHNNILRFKSKSILLKKKEQLHALALENRMFTHYRWY